jgi:uncharacterized protein YjbI with pentapeptide repeats
MGHVRPVSSRLVPVALAFLAAALLAITGFALWLPQAGAESSAISDLGLTLVGGSLALATGGVVAYLIMRAKRRFDEALRTAEDRRERSGMLLALASAPKAEGIDLAGKDLSGIWLRGMQLSGSLFSNAVLSKAHLDGATLISSDLTRTDLRDANLRGSNLQRARLSSANLTGAELTGAILDNSHLFGANFAADTTYEETKHWTSDGTRVGYMHNDAVLNGASLTGAHYDEATRWPSGYDADAHGAQREVVIEAPRTRKEFDRFFNEHGGR